jgi:hypothetical protein
LFVCYWRKKVYIVKVIQFINIHCIHIYCTQYYDECLRFLWSLRWKTQNINKWIAKKLVEYNTKNKTIYCKRLNGLGVWFSLWVREVPGSNPGWAHIFIPFLPESNFAILQFCSGLFSSFSSSLWSKLTKFSDFFLLLMNEVNQSTLISWFPNYFFYQFSRRIRTFYRPETDFYQRKKKISSNFSLFLILIDTLIYLFIYPWLTLHTIILNFTILFLLKCVKNR